MRNHRSGFTLLEVLVAFAIFSLTMGAVLATISTGLKGSRTASRHAVATLIAESKMAAVGIERPAQESGGSGTADGGYDWKISVSPYSVDREPVEDTGSFRPLMVEVTVSWDEAGKRRSVSLNGVRVMEER